jgi:very-short-patch-repair endonuclease
MWLLEIFGAENLADFGGPFPSGPVLEVELHEFLCAFDGFLFGFGPLLSLGGRRRLNVAVTRARQRLTLVSSFGHSDMDPSRVRSGTGVELLRNYLQYASTSGRQLSDGVVSDIPLNAFEAEVFDVLTSQGMRIIPQVGTSRFRIDLVVQHPKEPGRFVLAIECDGASYHSSPTARDRDRLRQKQLENLGWRFHRIWSTDWFMRKDDEVRRAVSAYQRALDFVDKNDQEAENQSASKVNVSISDVEWTTATGKREGFLGRRSQPRPFVPPKATIDDYSPLELFELIRWINSDGLLRTDEEILRDLVPELGFSRRGARIETAVRNAIRFFRANT